MSYEGFYFKKKKLLIESMLGRSLTVMQGAVCNICNLNILSRRRYDSYISSVVGLPF